MKQQTAVEFAIEAYEKFINSENGSSKIAYYWEELERDVKQAKEMEKEQSFTADDIKDAYTLGYLDGKGNHINDADRYLADLMYIKSQGK